MFSGVDGTMTALPAVGLIFFIVLSKAEEELLLSRAESELYFSINKWILR